MTSEQSKPKPALSKDFISLQDQCLNNFMDVRTRKNPPPPTRKGGIPYVEVKELDCCRSISQEHGKRMCRSSTLESLSLLVCFAMSLLLLPLLLPPLPPPPFLLLLLPIFILALLMVLAFMPSGVREVTRIDV